MKGIIIKILSIITVGGRHIKWLGLYMILMLSVLSCDTGFILPLDNNKFSYNISLSEDSRGKVSCMFFNGWHYLLFDLKGEYVVNPDSRPLQNLTPFSIILVFEHSWLTCSLFFLIFRLYMLYLISYSPLI